MVSIPHLFSVFYCSGLYISLRTCSMGKIRPRGPLPRNSFILHWLKAEYFNKGKHFDLQLFTSFFKTKVWQNKRMMGRERTTTKKTGKGQIYFYTLRSGDRNVFRKICFLRGRDLDLYRAMLVCNQQTLVLQTLINDDKQLLFFFHPRKAWDFNTRFTLD